MDVTSQAMAHRNGRSFDILTIAKGVQTQDIWFDVTNFFGSF